MAIHSIKILIKGRKKPKIEPASVEFRRYDTLRVECDAPSFTVKVEPTNHISPLWKTLEPYDVTRDQSIPGPGGSTLDVKLSAEGISAGEVEEALRANNERFVEKFDFTVQGKGIPSGTVIPGTWVEGTNGSGPGVPSDGLSPREDSLNGRIVDLDNGEGESFANDVQANIMKGHGREFGRYLMVRLGESQQRDAGSRHDLRVWLSSLAREVVTSAQIQGKQTKLWREAPSEGPKPDSGTIVVIGVTSHGYQVLGIQQENQPEDFEFRVGLRDFRPGSGDYNVHPTPWDPGQVHWDPGYREPIDLLIHLADDNQERLSERALDVKRRIAGVGEVVADERGGRRIHQGVDSENLIEHFGFVDGISNLEAGPKAKDQKPSNRKYWPKNSSAVPLTFLFAKEPALPGVPPTYPSYGSFGAFMKLEQDVHRFREKSAELGGMLGICPHEAEGLAVGRHQTGRPLVAAVGEDFNDFNFSGDGDQQCPYHSHVRRMNARRDSPFSLARRGMNYGPEREDLHPGVKQTPPGRGSGLLFLSYQSEIRRFSSRMFAALEPRQGGVDALIGRTRTDATNHQTQEWKTKGGDPVPFEMANFVTPRGGEYFFFPSLSFFRNLPAVKD